MVQKTQSFEQTMDWDAALSAGNHAAYASLRSAYAASDNAPTLIVGDLLFGHWASLTSVLSDLIGSVSDVATKQRIRQQLDSAAWQDALDALIDTLGEPLVASLLCQRLATSRNQFNQIGPGPQLVAAALLAPRCVITTAWHGLMELTYDFGGQHAIAVTPSNETAMQSIDASEDEPIVLHPLGMASGNGASNDRLILTRAQYDRTYSSSDGNNAFTTALQHAMHDHPLLLIGHALPHDDASAQQDPTHMLDLVQQFGDARRTRIAIIPAPADPRQRDEQLRFLGSYGITPIMTDPAQGDALYIVLKRLLQDTNPEASMRLHARELAADAEALDLDASATDDAIKAWQRTLNTYEQLASQFSHLRPWYRALIAQTRVRLGLAYTRSSQHAQAARQYEMAASIYVSLIRLGKADRHSDYRSRQAGTLNNLANAYAALQRYEDAEHAYDEAIGLLGQQLAETGSDEASAMLALALHNIADLHRDARQYQQAEREYREAVDRYRRLAGAKPDAYSPHLADTLNGLANLHRRMRAYEQAEDEYNEALRIWDQLDRTHPSTYQGRAAQTLNNLAILYKDTGTLAKAEETLQQALTIRRRLLSDHANASPFGVAQTLNNLANVHTAMHQYDKADKEYREALGKFRKLNGSSADELAYLSNVAQTIRNLADLHRRTGDWKQAYDECLTALDHYRRLAEANPRVYRSEVAATLSGLAMLQQDQRKYQQATANMQEALSILRDLAADDRATWQPAVAEALIRLAKLHRTTEQYDRSGSEYREALSILEALEADHPGDYQARVASAQNGYGIMLTSAKRYDEAESMLKAALKTRQSLAADNLRRYGSSEAGSWNNLANLHRNMQRFGDAIEEYERSIRLYRRLDAGDRYLKQLRRTTNSLYYCRLNQIDSMPRADVPDALYASAARTALDLADLNERLGDGRRATSLRSTAEGLRQRMRDNGVDAMSA